jgi:hypothetical protein
MWLGSSTGEVIESPDSEQIAIALLQLPGGTDSHIMLTNDAGAYVQAVGSVEDRFELYYRAGPETQLVQAYGSRHAFEDVATALIQFARRNTSWRGYFAWRPVDQIDPGDIPAYDTPKPEREKIIEISSGAIVISRTFVCNVLALIALTLGVILFFSGGSIGGARASRYLIIAAIVLYMTGLGGD